MTLVALLLALLGAGSTDSDCGRQGDRCKEGSNRARSGLAFFEFAPASGAGLPSAENLCGTLQPSEKVGNWWCLNGDGTMASGSTTTIIAAVDGGTALPAPESVMVCPNGPSCGTRTALAFSATLDTDKQAYKETADGNPFGTVDWTLCQVLQMGADSSTASYENYLWHGAAGTSGIDVLIQRNTGAPSIAPYSAGAPRGTCSFTFGAVHVVCMSRTDSTQRVRTYCDGTNIYDTSSTGLHAGSTGPWKVGGYDGASAFPIKKGSHVYGTFFTNSDLGSARIAAIARAVLSDTPTGAKGEALTYSRTGVRFCDSAGIGTTSNAGSMTPTNRPCVTSGGLLVESSRTNSVLRSQELSNAAWTVLGAGGAAAPTRTADYGTAPDGTATAERLEFNACTLGQASVVYQNYTGTAAATNASIFVKGTSGSGAVSIYFYDTTAGTGNVGAVACSFNSTTWTRCYVDKTFANTTHRLGIGCINDAAITGYSNTGAADVLLWGAQSEDGAYVTSYIPTTSAAAVRGADSSYVTPSAASVVLSFASTATTGAGIPGNARIGVTLWQDVNNYWEHYLPAVGVPVRSSQYLSPSSKDLLSAGAYSANATHRIATWLMPSTTLAVILDGTETSSSSGVLGSITTNRIYLGKFSAATGYEADGIISRVCVDPSPTRCR